MHTIPIMGTGGLLQQTVGFLEILIPLNPMYITPEPVVQAGEQVPVVLLQIQEAGENHQWVSAVQIRGKPLPGIRMGI